MSKTYEQLSPVVSALNERIAGLKSAFNLTSEIECVISDGYYDSNNGSIQAPSGYWQEKRTSIFDVKNVNAVFWKLVFASSVTQKGVALSEWKADGSFIGKKQIVSQSVYSEQSGTINTDELNEATKYIAFDFSTRGQEVSFLVNCYFSSYRIDKGLQSIEQKINGIDGKSSIYYGTMKPFSVCNIELLTTIATSSINSSSPGGMDVYNDILVMLFDGGGIVLWDLENNTKIGEYTLASGGTGNHANQAHFSTQMGTAYPLLYVSECYGSHKCFVEDITDSSSTLVQTISFANDDADYTGAYDWVLDNYNEKIMTYGETANGLMIKTFNVPSTGTSEVTLRDSDKIGQWVVTDVINETFTYQGATVIYGTLYLAGFVSNTGNYIWAIDKNTHSLKGRVDISDVVTYAHEIEDLSLYSEKLVASTHSKRVYSLDFN